MRVPTQEVVNCDPKRPTDLYPFPPVKGSLCWGTEGYPSQGEGQRKVYEGIFDSGKTNDDSILNRGPCT